MNILHGRYNVNRLLTSPHFNGKQNKVSFHQKNENERKKGKKANVNELYDLYLITN